MVHLRLLPAALIVAAAMIAACGGTGDGSGEPVHPGPTVVRAAPEGEPRTLQLGFGALPAEETNESYVNTFANAAQYAELVMITRAPPWADFLPGAGISDETRELTQLETALIDQYGLELVFAIDPTDGAVQRSRIAELPEGYDPRRGFLDEDVRAALIEYAAYVARNYDPAYLAVGVEINMLRDRAPEQFAAFLLAYDAIYTTVKETSPETKVFPTFQLEDLEGTLDRAHPPQWEALEAFRGRMDVLAISTYPYLAGFRSTADIRGDYYTQLLDHFDGEILIAEAGYASKPVEGRANVGTESDQNAFVNRLLSEANANGFAAVIWVAALDPIYAQGDSAVFQNVGLRHTDGANKVAWGTWEIWARRPIGEPSDP